MFAENRHFSVVAVVVVLGGSGRGYETLFIPCMLSCMKPVLDSDNFLKLLMRLLNTVHDVLIDSIYSAKDTRPSVWDLIDLLSWSFQV